MSSRSSNKLQLGDNFLRIIAQRMRFLRMAMGIRSQASFADQFGLVERTVWGIENGKALPPTDLLIKLQRLGVDINQILSADSSLIVLPPAGAPLVAAPLPMPVPVAGEPARPSGVDANHLLTVLLATALEQDDLQFIADYCQTSKAVRSLLKTLLAANRE